MAIFSKTESKPLAQRIQTARTEGRTRQALELAKQLAKQEPTPEHEQLLRAVTFERGSHLLKDGKIRDAIVVFNIAKSFDAPPEYRAAVAGKFAQLGDIGAALAMFAQLPECPERARAFEHAVDAALIKGPAGRERLPQDLHAAFDAVISAFRHLETSEDDAARDALQPIGLSSPFLEWKVMLRGLIAYYQKDDARAQDNWQRLSPERQPWRLVAPFRFHVDKSFRDAQPDAARQRLQNLIDRNANVGAIGALRGVEKALSAPWRDDKTVNEAFRRCKELTTTFAQSHPDAVRRMTELLYVKIAFDGRFEDANRFRASFPPPPDDPHLSRLQAMVGEANEEDGLPDAIEGWARYEADIATLADRFPEPSGSLARSLVLEHLGQLIAKANAEFKVPKHIPKSADCFRRSIALVPGRVRPHQLLIDELRSDPKTRSQAVTAAKKLVAEFPDHAATWEFLGDELFDDKPDKAVEAYRAALKGNPMRRDLRRKLADAVWAQGIKLATPAARSKAVPKPEDYRPVLEEAIRFTEGSLIARYAAWVVLETRLGHVEPAKELLAKAEAQSLARLAVPLALHVAAQLDKKLAAEIRDESATRWKQALQQKATSDEILVALETLVHFDSKALRGKKALVESFLPKLVNAKLEKFNEEQLLKLARRLHDLKMTPAARKTIEHGQRRFPKNPYFLLLLCDVLTTNGKRKHNWLISNSLQRARKIAIGLPREQQEQVVKEIERHEAKLKDDDEDFFGSLGKVAKMVQQMMMMDDDFDGPEGDPDDEEDIFGDDD